jgi:hypothetical protein
MLMWMLPSVACLLFLLVSMFAPIPIALKLGCYSEEGWTKLGHFLNTIRAYHLLIVFMQFCGVKNEALEVCDSSVHGTILPAILISTDVRTVLCCAMLCYAMLCCAVLCYAVLCYAMLCNAMLCYAMLC